MRKGKGFCLTAVIFFVLLSAACSAPFSEAEDENKTSSNYPDFGNSLDTELVNITLYYRNLNYSPGEEEELLISLQRYVPQSDSMARTTVQQLVKGPLPGEALRFNAAPLVNDNVELDDIYVRKGICVVHLRYKEPLFSDDLPLVLSEESFARAFINTLTDLPGVNAVWVFLNGSPFRGEHLQWLGPQASYNGPYPYYIYYRDLSGSVLDDSTGYAVLKKAEVAVEWGLSTDETGGGPFALIIELLSRNFDQERVASLPAGVKVRSITLQDGLLTIDLGGNLPTGRQALLVMQRSLVYTFTELPEIEVVLITVNGQTWSNGNFCWNYPLSREDLRQ